MRALLPLICSLPLLATPSRVDAAPPTRYVALVDFSAERDGALDPAWAPWDTALQQAARQLETQSAYADKQLRFCIINNTTLERLSNKSTSPDADKDGIPHCRINAANLAAAAPEGDPLSRHARAFGSVCDAFGSIHPSTAARCRAFSPRAATPAPLPPPAAPPPPAKPLTDYFEYAPGSAIDDFLAVMHGPGDTSPADARRSAPIRRNISVVKQAPRRPSTDGKKTAALPPLSSVAYCGSAHRGDTSCRTLQNGGPHQTAVELLRSLLTTPDCLDLRGAKLEPSFSPYQPENEQPDLVELQWMLGGRRLPPRPEFRQGKASPSQQLSTEYTAYIATKDPQAPIALGAFPDALRIDLNDDEIPPRIRVDAPLPISSLPKDAAPVWHIPIDLTRSWQFNAPRSRLRKALVGGFYGLSLVGLVTALVPAVAGRCLPNPPVNYDCAGYILNPRPTAFTAMQDVGWSVFGLSFVVATVFLVLPVQVRAKPVRVRLDSRTLEQGPSR